MNFLEKISNFFLFLAIFYILVILSLFYTTEYEAEAAVMPQPMCHMVESTPAVMVDIAGDPYIEEAIEDTTAAPTEPEPVLQDMGNFKLTAYCGCSICCGKWSGTPTKSGVMPQANHTIAVDTRVIPMGTVVVINGQEYVAEDTGGAIKGNKIDIYFDSHQEALKFGVQHAEVYIKN